MKIQLCKGKKKIFQEKKRNIQEEKILRCCISVKPIQ